MKKRERVFLLFLTVLLAVILPGTSVLAASAAKPLPSLSTNMRDNVAKIAESQCGYYAGGNNNNIYAAEIGGKQYESWCAYFVTWCMRKAGVPSNVYPQGAQGRCTEIVRYYLGKNQWHRVHGGTWSYNGIYDNTSVDSGYTPKRGDIVLFDKAISKKDGPEHIGIVTNYSNNVVTYVDGNDENDKVGKKTIYLSNNYILGFCSPAYSGSSESTFVNKLPVCYLDSVTGGQGTVTIRGWAYDPNSPCSSLPIHCYIGGDSTTKSAEGHGYIVADVYRPDVNAAYNITGNHGFEITLKTNMRGSQKVSVYAIDLNTGHKLVGQKTATIKEPYKIEFNKSSITVNENESTNVIVTFGGENINYMNAEWEGTNIIADVAWGTQNAAAKTQEIKFTAKKSGTNTLKVLLLDANMKSLYTKSIKVTVNHVHNYTTKKITKQPTCTEKGTRSSYCSCGAVSSVKETLPATGHKGGTATCTTKAKCTVCKAYYGNYKAHTYSTSWTVDKKATCTAAGSKSHHCVSCGAKKDVTSIPATGHKGGTATCTTKAKCSVCKAYYGNYKPHNYSTAWTVDKKETCTAAGSKSHHCVSCGAKTDVTSIPAAGHKGGTATCTEKAKCEICNQLYGEYKEHKFEAGKCITCGLGNGEEPQEPEVSEEDEFEDEEDEEDEDDGEEEPVYDVEIGDVLEDEDTGTAYEVTGLGVANTVEYLGADKIRKTMIIPDQVVIDEVTYQVTSIADGAFEKSKKLVKVVIGDNVKVIGEEAFYKCKNLKNVVLGDAVCSIGRKAFYGCAKLTTIVIPENVSKIDKAAFYGCRKLKNIKIYSENLTTSNVGAKAFKYINSKAVVYVPEGKVKVYKKLFRSKGAGSRVKFK